MSEIAVKKILVSACLAGEECRYDCQARPNAEIIKQVVEGTAIPVCPEQLGGLPTPRTPAEIIGDKVIDKNGNDVSKEYQNGAAEALRIAKEEGCTEAYLKAKSPMCGVGRIYDGSFSGRLIAGDGVFTKLLKSLGLSVHRVD